MKQRYTYHSWVASLLAALLLQVMLFQTLHHLWEDHHNDRLHCSTQGNDHHLHSEEYASPDCLLCYFHWQPSQLTSNVLCLNAPGFTGFTALPYQRAVPVCKKSDGLFLRGPPFTTA